MLKWLMVKRKKNLWLGLAGSSGGCTKLVNSGYILKVELAGFGRVGSEVWEKGETSDFGHDFGLSKWNNRY